MVKPFRPNALALKYGISNHEIRLLRSYCKVKISYCKLIINIRLHKFYKFFLNTAVV